MKSTFKTLVETTKTYPIIDNHAHPLLTAANKASFPLEAVFTEADGDAIKDSVHSLSCFRATSQLGQILGLDEPSWDDVKKKRNEMDYGDLCNLLMRPTGIQCLMLDDGLGGVAEMAEDWTWHRRFNCSVKRIVRIEIEAEVLSAFLERICVNNHPNTGYSCAHDTRVRFCSHDSGQIYERTSELALSQCCQ